MTQGKPPSQPRDMKLIVEKDVKIPMRDGAMLYADVFRPDGGAERFPAIMNIGPYQKDKLWIPPDDLEEKANPYLNWETANPLWWCPRGYALRARRCARLGQVAGQIGAELVPGRRRLLRCDRVDREAGLVLRQRRHARHLVSRELAVARRQPAAAVAESDHAVGRPRRPVSRPGVSRRHFRDGLHSHLVATNMAHHLLGRPRSYNPDAFNNNMLWNCAATTSIPSSGACAARDWDKITVPLYSVGNWGGFATASARQHRGLHARGVEAQEAAHPHRHALPSVPFGGRPHRPAALVRSLAERHDTGIMDEPPVKLKIRTGGGIEGPTRSASRTSGRSRARNGRRCISSSTANSRTRMASPKASCCLRRCRLRARPPTLRAPRRTQAPRLQPPRSTQGSIGRTGISFDRADDGGHRSHRPDRARPVGVEHVGRHGHLRDDPQHRTRRQGRVGSRPAGRRRGSGHQRLAARSHRKLDPENSLPYRPYHAHDERQWLAAGRDRRMPRRDLADVAWCSRKATACGSTSSRATASAPRSTALSRRLQHRRAEHDPRRRQASPICCCRSFPRNDRQRWCVGALENNASASLKECRSEYASCGSIFGWHDHAVMMAAGARPNPDEIVGLRCR